MTTERLLTHLVLRPTRASFEHSLACEPRGDGGVGRWIRGFEPFGKAVCVRVAIAAARIALETWEEQEPTHRAPHDRIAAAEAWLHCPCEVHVSEAAKLAWANGDDNPLKWTRLVVDGDEVDSMEAIYAHWSSDNAVNAASVDDAKSASEICVTAVGAATASFAKTVESSTERVFKVIDHVVRELTAYATATAVDVSAKERAFAEALARDPKDDATRVVFADWLEEMGRSAEATRLRELCAARNATSD